MLYLAHGGIDAAEADVAARVLDVGDLLAGPAVAR
jgi:hypothetical protein